ncbi:uncharacterized protein LOC132619434 [Lycium barbarum]|uniref:uncharacterized protein LOC132619434 n=1 Tax=Lycium barbarum TaxID=112863 RepID=UPI00293E0FA2|nr:uncharacterized protein LOC132619434 [Lycium barbarum]
MEVEELLNLFDSHWFQSEILKPKQPFITTNPEITPILETNEQIILEQTPKLSRTPTFEPNEQIFFEETSKLSRTPTFMVRSQSDKCLSSKDCIFSEKSQSPSPKSVLIEAKLQPILSGKEYNEFQFSSEADKGGIKNREKFRRRRKSNNSKSLSELEFDELKGFMDLGFEFSDKDKDSNLVSIIPGLKRLGRENERGFEEINESGISRPHLSEAWGVWEEKKSLGGKKNPLKSLRIKSDFGNEMEIKDQLKFWAHTVASTVR